MKQTEKKENWEGKFNKNFGAFAIMGSAGRLSEKKVRKLNKDEIVWLNRNKCSCGKVERQYVQEVPITCVPENIGLDFWAWIKNIQHGD